MLTLTPLFIVPDLKQYIPYANKVPGLSRMLFQFEDDLTTLSRSAATMKQIFVPDFWQYTKGKQKDCFNKVDADAISTAVQNAHKQLESMGWERSLDTNHSYKFPGCVFLKQKAKT